MKIPVLKFECQSCENTIYAKESFYVTYCPWCKTDNDFKITGGCTVEGDEDEE